MQDIPRWIRDYIVKKKCSCGSCKLSLNEKHITSIGIKFSYKNPTKEALFVELTCHHCGFVTKYEIRYMLLVEFSLDIIQELQEQQEEEDMKKTNKTKKDATFNEDKGSDDDYIVNSKMEGYVEDEEFVTKPKKEKSKITLKEIKESSKFLKKIKTHNEFLEAMGMNPEEIEKYNNITE